jgi:pilus assembly protein Flp/PilA
MNRKLLAHFVQDESGATAIEYGLMGSLIALAIIAAVRALGIRVDAIFQGITASI